MALNSVFKYIIQCSNMIIGRRIGGCQFLGTGGTPTARYMRQALVDVVKALALGLYLLTVHGPVSDSLSGSTTLYS